MGRYLPSADTIDLLFDIKAKESQLHAQETEYTRVLSRLEGLDVCASTKAILESYLNGHLTLKELNSAIDDYLSRKAGHHPDLLKP